MCDDVGKFGKGKRVLIIEWKLYKCRNQSREQLKTIHHQTLAPSRCLCTAVSIATEVASIGNGFKGTRKVKVLSLPEKIKQKSTF